jgi:hypothetical protein
MTNGIAPGVILEQFILDLRGGDSHPRDLRPRKRGNVADSNPSNLRGQHATITIVNTRAALAHEPTVITTLRPGLFQREIKVEHNDHVAPVNNFASDQL